MTNGPAVVSKFTVYVAGAVSLSFAGVRSAGFGGVGLGAAGFAAGFWPAADGAAGFCVGGLADVWARANVVKHASAAVETSPLIAIERSRILLSSAPVF